MANSNKYQTLLSKLKQLPLPLSLANNFILNRLEQLLSFYENDPKDSFIVFALAKEYETEGTLDKALFHYKELENLDPDYVGLYYHLAKLYEAITEEMLACSTYEKGITVAKKLGDFHALSELNNAYQNLKILMGN